MRRVISWSALFVAICLAACQGDRPTLTIVVANPPERAMASEVTGVVAAHSTLEFEIVDVNPGESTADYLVDGRAQLAFASNGQPYTQEIVSTVPLYTSVLHILYPADATLPTLQDLLLHENKFVGETSSSTLVLVRQIAALAGLDPETIASTAGALPHTAEVVFLLAPIGNNTRRLMRGHQFFSLGDPADIGKGTMAEGISTRIVQARPHIVSAWSYGLATPEPVLTLAVDTHIVMSQQLPEQAAYSFTQALVENKAHFSSSNSSLFEGIREDFDRTALTFPLHPGARRYLDRDEPTKFERYAEVANVGVYLLIILVTAGAALLRWTSRRKKERADLYYRKVLTIRAKIPYSSEADRVAALASVQSIYDEAFEKLMDERLAANESFQILISLCNDTLKDLASSAVNSQV